MKKHKPVKHAHRKAMIAQRKAKGKYSRPNLPNPKTCKKVWACKHCWALYGRKNCLYPLHHC